MKARLHKTTEIKLDNLYEAGFEAIFVSEKGICLGQNLTAEEIFGYSLDEAIGQFGTNWIAEKDRSLVNQKIKSGDEKPYQVLARKKDGSEFPVEIRGRMVLHENKQLRITSLLDISDRRLAEDKAHQGELVLDTIFNALPDLFFLIKQNGEIIKYRARQSVDLYVPPEAFLGKRMQEVLPKSVSELFGQNISKVVRTNQLVTFDYLLEIAGKQKYYEARISPIPNSQQLIIIARDISERKFAENEILRSEVKFSAVFKSNVVSVVVVNQQNRIVEWNPGSEKLFGYTASEAKNMRLTEMIPKRLLNQHKEGFKQAVQRKGLIKNNITHEVFGLDKNGKEFPIELTLGSWTQNGELFFSAMILDTSERKEAEQAILHQAHYDSLTDLPNRFLALDRLNQLLMDAKRNNELVAVLFLDLDDFKKVNDSLGHETGDKLLIEAARRLSSVIRGGDTVGRLGGDEFIILLPGLTDPSDARPIIESLLAQFRQAFKIQNRELLLTVSIGVAVYSQDGLSSSDLLRNADSAMYHAKNEGRNTYSYFTDSMNEEVARRLSLEEQIHGALERNEFEVFYQALRDIKSNKIVGAEALLRWHNSTLGNIPPGEFIPIAEQSGLINLIGMFVLEQSLCQIARWQKDCQRELKIAVNLSPRQFRDPGLVSKISILLNKYHLSASNLELEITEGVLMEGHSYIDESLNSLGEMGICIAMDDFGTGYSSMSYLRQYPFDILKIDRSFVRDIITDSADKALINATIVMAHALGLKVVAEGVETKQQLAILKQLDCDYVQGFLFGKPVCAADFVSQLENN